MIESIGIVLDPLRGTPRRAGASMPDRRLAAFWRRCLAGAASSRVLSVRPPFLPNPFRRRFRLGDFLRFITLFVKA